MRAFSKDGKFEIGERFTVPEDFKTDSGPYPTVPTWMVFTVRAVHADGTLHKATGGLLDSVLRDVHPTPMCQYTMEAARFGLAPNMQIVWGGQ